ncbi:retrovirus-related pol polyprotein from transposon TNT 1-94 [Tanacetum coccineum]
MDHQTSLVPQIAYHSPQVSTQPMTEFPQLDSSLAVLMFTQRDDPIACINKAMAFLSTVAASRFPSTNNRLRTSSNTRNQATIQDDRVTMQQVQVRQGQSYVGTSYKGNPNSPEGNNAGGKARVVKCYNCKGEGHMARQYTQPKRTRNTVWFIDKAMLAEAHESDAYDSDCDDISNAKLVLMANLSNYGSDAAVKDTNLYAQQDSMILSVIEQMSEQMINYVNNWEKDNQEKNNESFTAELERYKERKAQRIKPTLYDGSVISSQPAVIPVIDDEETLILEEVSRSKMLAKQNDPISKEKKINTTPIIYVELNQLFEDFGKRFAPQQELSTEQAFWLQTLHPNTDQYDISPVKIEAPRELPKTLKDIFNVFDKDLLNEVTEVQTVFNQMEAAVQQSSVDKQCFKIHKKELFLDNDRLLHQIMSQDVMLCVMNFTAVFGDSVNLEMQSSESHDKCSDLDVELLKNQNAYNELLKSYSQLEKHCISLELPIQLNQEIFQKDKSCDNQHALEILEFFENNDLKAQLQAKDTTIRKLKEHIKSMRENDKKEKVKQDMDEIKTINIELEHSVAKLLSKNKLLHKEIEHLKKIYKDQFDSIKKTRALSKEQCDSLIYQLNTKSMENEDLKGQIQEKGRHIDYLKYTQEQADILRGIVKQTKAIQPLDNALYFACISHQTYVARTPQQNGVVERQNQTLVEAARIMLIFSKAPLFMWAEAINTACYTQNHSLIRLRYNKTPYELMYDKKLDLSFLYVFGSLCYPTNDSEDLGKLNVKADIADSPVSTSVDQDAPTTSIPSTQEQEQSPIISQGVKESLKTHTFMMIYFMKLFMKTQLLKDHHLITMTSTTAQQVALDNALVAPENRVQIGKCNMRIDPTKTPKEPTY